MGGAADAGPDALVEPGVGQESRREPGGRGGARPFRVGEEPGQGHGGGVLEEPGDLHLAAEFHAEPVGGLDGLEGLGAQVEHVVVDRHGPGTEEAPPDARDGPLQRASGGRCPVLGRLGEQGPVALPRTGTGQPLHELDGGGDHRGGQPGPHALPHVGGGRCRALGHQVGEQAPGAVREDLSGDGHFPDPGMGEQGALHLGGLHPMSAGLELGVGPAHVAQLPVLADADQVPGAVGARGLRESGERGEARAVGYLRTIAVREGRAEQVQLAVDHPPPGSRAGAGRWGRLRQRGRGRAGRRRWRPRSPRSGRRWSAARPRCRPPCASAQRVRVGPPPLR